jgi:hypothetical protein
MPHPCPHHCPPEGGVGIGGLVPVIIGVLAAAAVVAFAAAHIVLLAVCAGVFTAVMGGVAVFFRWAASPERLRPRAPVTVTRAGRPARVISAARPQAIEAPRAVPAQVNLPEARHVRLEGGPSLRRSRE